MKRIACLILLSMSSVFAQRTAFAQQSTPAMVGSWTISGDVQGFPIDEACVFTQTGDTIGGTCLTQGKSYPTTVKVDGTKVVLVHGGDYDGQALTLTFTASFNDKGELAGKIDVSPMGVDGTFTAKKAEAK